MVVCTTGEARPGEGPALGFGVVAAVVPVVKEFRDMRLLTELFSLLTDMACVVQELNVTERILLRRQHRGYGHPECSSKSPSAHVGAVCQ